MRQPEAVKRETPLKSSAGRGTEVWARFCACIAGDPDRVRERLEQEPSLVNRVSDYNGHYLGGGAPIKNAAARGHLEMVNLLLERGADPNLSEEGIAPQGHALYSAAAVFAANRALANDPDAQDNAAGEGHEGFVRLMLRCQPDLPRRGHSEIVGLLRRYGGQRFKQPDPPTATLTMNTTDSL